MCGIVGASAQRDVANILLEGLKRLEYRGYDSAGMAIIHPKTHEIQRQRVIGKVSNLSEALTKQAMSGRVGIAHTRWATHGQPTQANAHPHWSHNKEIAIVHNGIIENHEPLRQQLIEKGYEFASETDTEVIVHLMHYHFQTTDSLISAILETKKSLKGAYALGIICSSKPDCLYAVRCGSPLVIGCGIDENFIASDPLALLPVTQQFIYLEEGDVARIKIDSIEIYDDQGKPINRKINTTHLNSNEISKGKYRHFMQKEIYDQPQAIADTLERHFIYNRLSAHSFGHQAPELFTQIRRVHIVACGTSYHAGLIGKYWLEEIAGLPTQVEIASENRYRKLIIEPNTLFLAISQSGETADTLAALKQAKQVGYATTLGMCNVAQSSLVREADLAFLTHAGIEIGVAATKTFTAQLVGLLMLAIILAQTHQVNSQHADEAAISLRNLPNIINEILNLEYEIRKISKRFSEKHHALFLGRGLHYPVALEGALKLKEISYLHAEAYPAGELKHGPLALVDEQMPVIVIAPQNKLIDKLASNIQEVQARGGELYIFSDHSIEWSLNGNSSIIPMPSMPEIISPIGYSIPLQLLAYHVAVHKGTDVDQPRNLAKSVTVE